MNIKKEFYKFNKNGFLNKPNSVNINYELLHKKILDYCDKLEEINWGEIRFDSNPKLGKVTRKGGISIVNTIGWIEQIDEIVDSVIGQFKDLIDFTLPNGWIISQVAVRISLPGDNELGLHTDTDGEYGIGILLNDWFNDSATTCFLPGTHKWPFTFREITGFPRISTFFINKIGLLKTAKGKAGTSYFFDHNALHGRMANNTNKQNIAILVSIFDIKKAPRIFDNNVINNIESKLNNFSNGLLGSSKNSNKFIIPKDLESNYNFFNYAFFKILKFSFLPVRFALNFIYYSLLPKLKKLKF